MPRNQDGTARQTNLELGRWPGGHCVAPCVVVHEDESRIPFRAHRCARNRQIDNACRKNIRDMHHHGSQVGAEIVQEVLKDLHFAKGSAFFAEFAQRRLKVIGFDGHIVGIARGLRLLQGGQLAVGVFAALEHIRAIKVHARAKHDRHHGSNVIRLDHGTPVVGNLIAAAELRGEKGPQTGG